MDINVKFYFPKQEGEAPCATQVSQSIPPGGPSSPPGETEQRNSPCIGILPTFKVYNSGFLILNFKLPFIINIIF